MKRKHFGIVIMLVVVFTIGASYMVQAGGYTYKEVNKIETLKAGDYTRKQKNLVTEKKDTKNKVITFTNYCYKIVIPEDGIVTFYASNPYKKKATRDSAYVYLYSSKTKALKYPNDYVKFPNLGSPGFLKKGTYYLTGWNVTGNLDLSESRLKYTYRKAVYGSNKSFEKASSLKANKTAWIVQTPKKHYFRYYKFKLTKKQKIHYEISDEAFWVDGVDQNVTIFNSKYTICDARRIKMIINDNGQLRTRYSTTKVLPAGTYYAEIDGYYPDPGARGSSYGDAITFKWW